jgi:hypothetical protein
VGDGCGVGRDVNSLTGCKSLVAVRPRLWQRREVVRWFGVVAFEPYGSDCGCRSLGYEQTVFEQDGEVDEVADSGVLAFPKSRSMPWNFSAACRWMSTASTSTAGIPAKAKELGMASLSVA